MTVPILCLVVVVQMGWVFLLKLRIERLEREKAMRDGIGTGASTPGSQKGMRRFVIGKNQSE